MLPIKLVLADVDGTLVTHEKILTTRAISRVRALADAGIAFAITSGRPPRGMHGDSIKVMADYIHTWSDFRAAHPQFGNDQFDEIILRLQVMF